MNLQDGFITRGKMQRNLVKCSNTGLVMNKQRLTFDIITSQNGNDNEPVHIIVCETAVTGKTF